MTSSNKRNLIVNLIISYLITFAIFNLGGFAASDIVLGVIFVAIFAIMNRIRGTTDASEKIVYDRAQTIAAHVISALWTVLYWIYAAPRLGGGMENRLFVIVYTVFTIAGIYLLLFFTLRFVICRISEKYFSDPEEAKTAQTTETKELFSGSFDLKRFFLRAGIIFVCLLPLFLMNYPGTMTIDSYEQLNQARWIYPYYDLHPWAHTMFIGLMYRIGYAVTGSELAGIATFTIAQMILLALSVSYSIEALAEAGLNKAGRIALLLGYLLYPYNIAYAITMWKDVLFGAAVLVFTITLYRVAVKNAWSVRDIIIFIISGIGTCLFRHNGFYAFIATMIVFLIYMRRNIRVSLILTISIIAFTCIFNGPVKRAYNVEKVEFAHSLTIPLQQIARVVAYNGDISAEDMEMIERVNTAEYLRSEYTPGGSDPTMQWMIFGDSAYVESHKLEYLGLWMRLGIHNPHAYVDAYIDQTRGYYTTMQPEQTEFYGLLPNGDDLYNAPVFLATKRIKINEILFKLHNFLPVYSMLYSPGACLQLMMLGVALILTAMKKGCRGYALIAYLPMAALTLTVLIAAPLCADLRYAYGLMISFPELIAMTFLTYSFKTS
ncbi:MAG: DUF6020 family protein [Lachnospiraceae bacterium]|nr:DUF6020 family protein [Lachnospiraceae bacterium]